MASVTAGYGSRTQFAQYANLDGLTNNAAKVLGKIANNTTQAMNYQIEVKATLGGSGVSSTGVLEFYLLESGDDTTYTDGISATGASDISASIKNAKFIKSANANANSQVVNDRFQISVVGDPFKYTSIIAYNKTGATLAGSGNNDAYFTALNPGIA